LVLDLKGKRLARFRLIVNFYTQSILAKSKNLTNVQVLDFGRRIDGPFDLDRLAGKPKFTSAWGQDCSLLGT
jgi:hypothetical protein